MKPITGLTSEILIRVAQIGYDCTPNFELYAPGQLSLENRIGVALLESEIFRQACKSEHIDVKQWKRVMKNENTFIKGKL